MGELTRREALRQATTPGMLGALADDEGPVPATDREFVIAAGMTEAGADCRAKVAEAAGAFLELPELHPMDEAEVATAIHVVQDKLLARPTYRRYLELAKQAAQRRKEAEPK